MTDLQKLSKDGIAQELYGHRYNQLSAWAKAHVDSFLIEFNHNDLNSREAALRAENAELESRIAQLEIENLDLWEENQELKIRLTEQEHEG